MRGWCPSSFEEIDPGGTVLGVFNLSSPLMICLLIHSILPQIQTNWRYCHHCSSLRSLDPDGTVLLEVVWGSRLMRCLLDRLSFVTKWMRGWCLSSFKEIDSGGTVLGVFDLSSL